MDDTGLHCIKQVSWDCMTWQGVAWIMHSCNESLPVCATCMCNDRISVNNDGRQATEAGP
jgi:hypothetical protein